MEIPDRATYRQLKGRLINVFFNGERRKNDVVEYCISEGWIKVHVKDARGRLKVERGEYVAVKLTGKVEVTEDDRN